MDKRQQTTRRTWLGLAPSSLVLAAVFTVVAVALWIRHPGGQAVIVTVCAVVVWVLGWLRTRLGLGSER